MWSETNRAPFRTDVSAGPSVISLVLRACSRICSHQKNDPIQGTIYPCSKGTAAPLAGHTHVSNALTPIQAHGNQEIVLHQNEATQSIPASLPHRRVGGVLRDSRSSRSLAQCLPQKASRSSIQRAEASSLLLELPIELIQLIARRLPLSSAAVFSITSRALAAIIGFRYLADLLQAGLQQQILFLSIMGQDVPYCMETDPVTCCDHSATIRPATKVPHPIPCIERHVYIPFEDYRTFLLDCLCEYHHLPRRLHEFTFKRHRVQLSIQLRQCGLSGSEVLSSFKHSDRELGFSVEPQIFNHELILRESYSLPSPKPQPQLPYSQFDWNFAMRRDAPQFPARLCPHIEDVFIAPLRVSSAGHEFQRAYKRPEYIPEYQTAVESCSYCCTDYQLWYDFATERVEVRVWKNLGDGRFPPEKKWLSQLATGWRYEATESKMDYKPGSVYQAFESIVPVVT